MNQYADTLIIHLATPPLLPDLLRLCQPIASAPAAEGKKERSGENPGTTREPPWRQDLFEMLRDPKSWTDPGGMPGMPWKIGIGITFDPRNGKLPVLLGGRIREFGTSAKSLRQKVAVTDIYMQQQQPGESICG